jgi:hypothetical protein
MPSITDLIAADVAAHRAGAVISKLPTMRAEDIVITFDKMNRAVAVIPDAVALELRKAVAHGWREFRGQADGESRFFRAGTWTHDTTELIINAYAQAEVPAGLDERDRLFVERGIRAAREWGQCAGSLFIVGRIAWDFDARWWRFDVRSEAHRSVCPSGYPNHDRQFGTGDRGIRYSG